MITEPEDLSPQLREPTEAALDWINATQQREFKLSGVVDADKALQALDAGDSGYDLGLVLCDGELCAREQVRVDAHDGAYHFRLEDSAERDIPPLLDPPPGIRKTWLDQQLQKYEFVMLLFYRGLW